MGLLVDFSITVKVKGFAGGVDAGGGVVEPGFEHPDRIKIAEIEIR